MKVLTDAMSRVFDIDTFKNFPYKGVQIAAYTVRATYPKKHFDRKDILQIIGWCQPFVDDMVAELVFYNRAMDEKVQTYLKDVLLEVHDDGDSAVVHVNMHLDYEDYETLTIYPEKEDPKIVTNLTRMLNQNIWIH